MRSRRAAVARVAAMAALALASIAMAGSARPPAAMPKFAPEALEEPKAGQPVLRDQTWVLEAPFGVLRIQMLDPEQRLAFIRHLGGPGTPDPFAASHDQPERFLAFVLELENTDEGQLSFNPLTTWLVSNREWENQSPLGLTDLGFMYRSTGRALPPAFERVSQALLAEPVMLDPGESVAGLLVFRAVHAKTKWLRLQPVLVPSSGDIVRPSATYRWVKPEKNEKKNTKDE